MTHSPSRASRRACALLALLLLALFVPLARAGGDALKTYKKRYTKDAYLSEKEDVIAGLVATGDIKAVAALEWCADVTRGLLERRKKEEEKAYKAYQPVWEKLIKKEMDYVEQMKKRGKPIPKTRPRFPEDEKIIPLRSALKRAEKRLKEERTLLDKLLDASGALTASLPPADQQATQDRWKAKTLADKDWTVRARGWEMVAHTDTEWALQMLLDGAMNEPDPRVLAKVIGGLGGRKPALVLPVFENRLGDARWLVRAAVIAALAETPAKETIDLLIQTLEIEQGRLQDDCVAALQALTGADLRIDVDLWKRYWKDNREAWTGPPKPPEETDEEDGEGEGAEGEGPVADGGEKGEDADDAKKERTDKDRQTGFFGIQTKSRRLVYVIDVSGSMNEPAGPASGPTRASLAKEELKRAILALEDGATFNIIFFSAAVKPWKKKMAVAERKTRLEAVEFIDKVEVVGGTATFDALESAYQLASLVKGKSSEPDPSGDSPVDTIILLSDGKPSLGRYTQPDQIRAHVREWNEDRRIALHTIAFGADADKAFMEGLATDTGGRFVAK